MNTLYKICLCILCGTVSLSAQITNLKGNGTLIAAERNVGEYEGVFVGGAFDLEFIEGTEGRIHIEIEENLLPYLITEVNRDKLILKWKDGYHIKDTQKSKIRVPVKSISAITLGGSGTIDSSIPLYTNSMHVDLGGSGTIRLPISATNLSVNLSGSGNIELSGMATSIECALAGSGNIRASSLNTNRINVQISGSGDVHIGQVDTLNVRVSGSGIVTYKGNPQQNIKISGSGNVYAN
ncbi:DUF2807 domain-containing protein [Flavobacteriaceae bacterium F08102]|nr:DUF2807 domain-containing protein [Flavobacteriaceae bacterium F08102]